MERFQTMAWCGQLTCTGSTAGGRVGGWESQDCCVEAADVSCCAGDSEHWGMMHCIGIKRKDWQLMSKSESSLRSQSGQIRILIRASEPKGESLCYKWTTWRWVVHIWVQWRYIRCQNLHRRHLMCPKYCSFSPPCLLIVSYITRFILVHTVVEFIF